MTASPKTGARATSYVTLASAVATLVLPFTGGTASQAMVVPAVVGALILVGAAGLAWASDKFGQAWLLEGCLIGANLMISGEGYLSLSRTHGDAGLQLFYLLPILLVAYYRSKWSIAIHVALAGAGSTFQVVAAHGDLALGVVRGVVGLVVFGVVSEVIYRLTKEEQSARAELNMQASTDPLTSLLNRRGLESWWAEHQPGMSILLMVDIDHFKNINDTYGHEVGDLTLKRVASTLARSSRDTDAVARFGGEEFLCVLPGMSTTSACSFTERVAQQLQKSHGLGRAVTASFGMALWHPNDNLDDVVRRADEALYSAKEHGRNQTQFNDDILGPVCMVVHS